MRWKPKTWIDRELMGDIAKDFVNFKESRHGNDSVHFICGNLDTHCCKYVLNNFGAINILV